jgi:RHS repeat-associated protein
MPSGYSLYSFCRYTTFGSVNQNRSFANTAYRYGFNGKENDRETVGTGQGTQDYGARIYNPSLGKFLSIDPLIKKYPELTPYQFASCTPIQGNDFDGKEIRYKITPTDDGKTLLEITIDAKLINKTGVDLDELTMENIKKDLEKGVSDIFTKNFDDKNLIIKTAVNLTIAESSTYKDFAIELVDKVTDSKEPQAVGHTKQRGNTETNRIQIKMVGRSMKNVIRTLAHEIGHAGGLGHLFDKDTPQAVKNDKTNIMKSFLTKEEEPKNTNVVSEQFDKIKESVDNTQKAVENVKKQKD